MKSVKPSLFTIISQSYSQRIFYLLVLLFLCSHDLYLKMDSYFLEPNQEAVISLYNGTFERSENIITRDRMLDASVVSRGERTTISDGQWTDLDSTITQLPFRAGEAGTYVVGVSTKARNIELTAQQFNSYLEHDGVLDMLETRKTQGLMETDAVESYQKHVKAIYQVGDARTNDWNIVLGYPIEFVPQANPYDRHTGDKLEVQLLLDGQPLANQLVYADYLKSAHSHSHDEHSHDHDGTSHSHDHKEEGHSHSHSSEEEPHSHTSGQQLRTDEQGIVSVILPEDGIYYLRTIHMVAVEDDSELTHESKWATLTFEVTHDHHYGAHSHDHDHGGDIPTWWFIVGSILIIGLLFLVFRKSE